MSSPDDAPTYIYHCIIDLECVDIVVVFVCFIYNNISEWVACVRYKNEDSPPSTPTTEVNISASLDAPLSAGFPFCWSSLRLSASRDPGITRPPLTGALLVVKVDAMMLLSA